MTTHLYRRRGLVWFGRDLRLDDNPEWAAATPAHDEVTALFVIHEPGAAGPLDLTAAVVVLGETYPFPIVDHREARERALTTYKRALEGDAPWSR